MDMSFLYSYKPVLYPVAASTFDQQYVDTNYNDSDDTVLSLVALCCQKIVQVHVVNEIYLTLHLFLNQQAICTWPTRSMASLLGGLKASHLKAKNSRFVDAYTLTDSIIVLIFTLHAR